MFEMRSIHFPPKYKGWPSITFSEKSGYGSVFKSSLNKVMTIALPLKEQTSLQAQSNDCQIPA